MAYAHPYYSTLAYLPITRLLTVLCTTVPLFRKLRELRSERDHLRDQLGKVGLGRLKLSQEAREREELLARRNAVR